jgi:hypothetical protein
VVDWVLELSNEDNMLVLLLVLGYITLWVGQWILLELAYL